MGAGKAGGGDGGGEPALRLVQASYEVVERDVAGVAGVADDDGQPHPGMRLGDQVQAKPVALDERRGLGDDRHGQAVDRSRSCRPVGPRSFEPAKAQLVGDRHRALEGADDAHEGDGVVARAAQAVAAGHPSPVEAQSGAGDRPCRCGVGVDDTLGAPAGRSAGTVKQGPGQRW
ncbi:MAG: hypothetical protein M3P85_11515 [Actinomycetota bacterium]|nr:hypothetical protein [Actinomycetota bacterium]